MSDSSSTMIYFAPVGKGGLAQYAEEQISAIADLGIRVVAAARPHLAERIRLRSPLVEVVTLQEPDEVRSRLSKLRIWVRSLRRDAATMRMLTRKTTADAVLISAFAEYFSPFWIRSFENLGQTRVGAIVHDPIRDFRMGPSWWHNYCVRTAYRAIDTAFSHDDTPVDTCGAARPTQVSIPHGPYDVPEPAPIADRTTLRCELGLPESAKVLLAFGHIRDGKNLDLAIQALRHHPEVHLLVVGREQSSAQKPVRHYEEIARQLQVADRCHWVNRFVADAEVFRFFKAADAVLLLYSQDFRSASGVLNNASQFKLPVLASSGNGPLRTAVTRYCLGEFVAPDSAAAVEQGLARLLSSPPNAKWEEFRADHSWQTNAETIVSHLLPRNHPSMEDE